MSKKNKTVKLNLVEFGNFQAALKKASLNKKAVVVREVTQEQLDVIRNVGSGIFSFDAKGKLIKIRKGKFILPLINPLYVLLNYRKVMAFLAVLVDYVFANLEDVVEGEYEEDDSDPTDSLS